MADEALTREDFIKLHGFDPEGGAVAPVQKGIPSIGNAARDVAVGAVTALPDLLALPGVMKAGAGALYDKVQGGEFGKGFAKRLRVDDADERTTSLVREKQQEWRKQFPEMTAEDVNDLTKQFMESKEFDDFNNTLLRDGGVKLSSKIKSGVRDFVGDTRGEKEKGWVDSGLEVLGSALVGVGPGTAAKLGTKLATTAVGKTLLENTASRTALRVAEAVTPLTLPLTPTNVAINAGAGIALDQGMRYALGDTTAFDANDANLGGIATVAGATGAAALVVGALRGRAARIAEQAVQVPAPNTPEMAAAIAKGSPEGAALVAGKRLDEFADGPPVPALNSSGGIVQSGVDFLRRGQGAVVDEFRPTFDLVERVHGKEAARQLEAEYSNLTGAGGRDTANAKAASAMRGVLREIDNFSPEELADLKGGWLASVAESRNLQVEKRYADELAEYAAKQQAGKLTQKEAVEFSEKQAAYKQFMSDGPASRRMLPDIPRAQIQEWDNLFRSNPRYERVRGEILRMNDNILNEAVESGAMTRSDAAAMRSTTPFYAPLQQDPLEGATGAARLARGFLDNFNREKYNNLRGANKPLVRSVDTEIKTSGDVSRITKPLDPVFAYSVYAKNMYSEMQNNTARRLIIDALEKDASGGKSPYLQNNNIQRLETNGRVEFSSAEVRAAAGGNGNPAITAALNDPEMVRVVRNGNTSFYKFGDAEVASLMRLEPKLFTGWAWAFKAAADAFKTNTTGALAPVFAPINALYDTTLAGAIRPANRAFGPVDTLMRRAFGEQIGKQVGGRVFDPTAYAALPWHAIAGMGEVVATKVAHVLAQDMANNSVMRELANTIGIKNYEKLVERMLLATERSKTMIMLDRGIAHNSAINHLPEAMNAYSYAASAIPSPVRATYTFYKDLVNAVHSAPKRQFFAQNHMLLEQKYGPGKIPAKEMERLIYDTRALAGDMTRQAQSKMLQQLEASAPYLAPMRNGIYALGRGMSNADSAQYVWPRLTMMMSGVMASFYMMSNWDDAARDEFWKNTPEWMRYRYLHVPSMELLQAWARGEKPAFDPKLIYKMPIGPDLAPIVAGSAAFLRGIGALPNEPGKVITSGGADFSKMVADMVAPVLPPLITAPFAAIGAQVDISGADARGGNWLRISQGNPFRRGPQEESASNLGEMNTTTQNFLGTLFGANGTYIARAYDAFVHAMKFDAKRPDTKTGLSETRAGGPDYYEGLKAATTTFVDQNVRRVPDVPLLWKGNDKQYTQTPVQVDIAAEKMALASITGIRDSADLRALGSKAGRANEKRGATVAEGGIVQRYLTDPNLLRVADDVRKWNARGDFADLKKSYGTLAQTRRSLEANYTMPRDQRMEKINALIDKMQDNQEQQRLAIQFKLEDIKTKYGAGVPALQGVRSMKDFDQLLRDAIQ